MLRYGLIAAAGAFLLLSAVTATADNGAAAPIPPTKPTLDVTMNVVPLNADIEKTVVQTITLPIIPPADIHKQAAKAKEGVAPSATQKTPNSGSEPIDKTRESVLRGTVQAKREAAEAAKEARKDSNNSSVPDNDPPPFR